MNTIKGTFDELLSLIKSKEFYLYRKDFMPLDLQDICLYSIIVILKYNGMATNKSISFLKINHDRTGYDFVSKRINATWSLKEFLMVLIESYHYNRNEKMTLAFIEAIETKSIEIVSNYINQIVN